MPASCDRRRRDTHSSTDTVSASHSANPLAEAKRVSVQAAPRVGASAITSTTSSATPSMVASRVNRHRSGNHGSRGADSMVRSRWRARS